MQSEKKQKLLRDKFLFTILILVVYLIGKNLPLYGIELFAYTDRSLDTEMLLIQAISGDMYRRSVFALGISPYMMSTIFVQMVVSCRNSEAKARISPKKKNRVSLGLMFLFALFQAVLHVKDLVFMVSGTELYVARVVAVLEMITGAMIILWLVEQNKKYGIGGQSVLIFVNILDGIEALFMEYDSKYLMIGFLVALLVVVVTIVLEDTEKRIPLQRISIHNIYADKNYLAIKMNPIGVMPVMFSTAFFMLPQLLVRGLHWLFPKQETILWWQENLSLSTPVGVAVYVVILYVLTIGFSRVFLNPSEVTEQFLKNGDSLVDIHAGRETKRYLSQRINRMSVFSATVFSLCLCVPMAMRLKGMIDQSFAALPSSILMLAGIWSSLYRETVAVKHMDSYKTFI